MCQESYMKKENRLEILMGIFIVAIVFVLLFIVFNYNSEPHFKIYKEGIEVDELVACCLNTADLRPSDNLSKVDNNTGSTTTIQNYGSIICFSEENLEYFKVPCETIKKEDLTIEWLDFNSLCQDCEGTYDVVYRDYVTCDIKCSRYKFGKYIIEVLK